MTDVHTPEQRSRNMASIKGKNTQPEMMLRKALWKRGLRYRLKSKLPGKPDIIFPRLQIAIFVDGCFWHKCPTHFIMPKTRKEFWKKKIDDNCTRDKIINKTLEEMGWSVVRIWEHELRSDLVRQLNKVESLVQEKKSNIENY